jgi:hypothetical protein
MVTAQTGANAPVTVIVILHLVVIVPVTETVTVHLEASVPHTATAMVRLVVSVPTVQQGIAPHMETVVTAMPVQNEVVLAVEVPMEHPEGSVPAEIVQASPRSVTVVAVQNAQSVQAEIVVASPHLVTVMDAQSVLPTGTVHSVASVLAMVIVVPGLIVAVNVHPMEIVHNVVTVPVTVIVMAHLVVSAQVMVIVVPGQTEEETDLHTEIVVLVQNAQTAPAMVTDHSVEIVLPMVTVALVQNVVVIAPPMANVQNDHALVTEVVDQIVQVLPVLVAVRSVLAGKSQNSPKNSAWRANYVWFVLTTMILGLMMMSPVTSSTRLHATN